MRSSWLDFGDIVDEEVGDGDLRTHIAELCCDAPEQRVLLTQGLVLIAGLEVGAELFAVGHVRVCNLGDWSKVKDNGQDKYKDSNTQIRPGDVVEALIIDIGKKNTCGQKWSSDRAYGLDRL